LKNIYFFLENNLEIFVISELENEKYMPYCIGSNPKDILTHGKIIETINEFVKKPSP